MTQSSSLFFAFGRVRSAVYISGDPPVIWPLPAASLLPFLRNGRGEKKGEIRVGQCLILRQPGPWQRISRHGES